MANEKVFKIKIDGITRAYSDVIDLSKALEELENKKIKINVDSSDVEELISKVEETKDIINDLPDIDINADLSALEKANDELDSIKEKMDSISQNTIQCNIDIQTSDAEESLEDLVTEVEDVADALETLFKSMYSLSEVTEIFDSTCNTAKDTLSLFGIENTALDGILTKLSKTIGIVNSIQKISNTIVEIGYKRSVEKAKAIAKLIDLGNKETKGLKASTAAQNANTVAIGGGIFALKAFSKALVATGVGAMVTLLGYLTANFEDVKKQILELIPGLDGLGDTFDEIKAVFMGVGNVLLQYVLTPIKAVAAAIPKLLKFDFSGALEEAGKAVKEGLDVIGNYEKGHDKQVADNKEKRRIAEATAREKELNDQIEDNLAKQGSDWKYSEEAKKIYSEMFQKRLEMYKENSDEYKKALREKEVYDREYTDKQKAIAAQALADKQKKEEAYKNAVASVNREIKAIDEESNKRNIANQKKTIENAIKAAKSIKVIDEVTQKAKEDALNSVFEKQKEVILAEVTTAEEAAREKYDKLIAEAKRLGLDITSLEEKKADEIKSIQDTANSEILEKEIQKNEDIKAISNELVEYNKQRNIEAISEAKEEMSEMKEVLTEEYADIQKKLKEATVKGAGGIIDPKKTKENLNAVIGSLQEYKKETINTYNTILKKYDELIAKEEVGSNEYKRLLKEKEKVTKESEEAINKINKDLEKASEQSAKTQGQYFKELAEKVKNTAENIMKHAGAIFDAASSVLGQQLEEAKAKYEEINKQYDEVVKKQEESNSRLQELQEQASNTRGGRGLVLQQQIDAEMAKNQQLAAQEKKLAKEKEKQEKEIAKKEKKQKRLEIIQNIAQAIVNTSLGIMKANAMSPPTLGMPWSGIIGATGAVQVGVMTKQLSKLEDGGLLKGKRHTQGGMRVEGTNIEVEGGEYVVNRESTNRNLELLRYINTQRKELQSQDINAFFSKSEQGYEPPFRQMFEQGGQLPPVNNVVNIDNESLIEAIQAIRIEPKVSVTDINAAQDKAVEVSAWSGI